jgi:hypothetical protein
MVIAFLIICLLGLVAFIRLIENGVGGFNTLTGTFILIDIILLSIIIIGFLINIVFINQIATKDLPKLLMRTKKELLIRNQTSSKEDIEKNNLQITHLNAMCEQISFNKDLYSITILGLFVDEAFVLRVLSVLFAHVFAAFASTVKKHTDFD